MRFEFATAARILVGRGVIDELAPIAAQMGRRAFVVTGRNKERAAPLLDSLARCGMECSTFIVKGEPTVDVALAGSVWAREFGAEVVIGFGGGSAIDSGKVIAALQTNSGDLQNYLEVIGRGQKIANPPAPYIAIPTTAGAGAEVTSNAVLGSPKQRVKVSMRSPLMLPRLVVVDPMLTISMPPSVTAATGLDTLTQLLEAFVSHEANALTGPLCRDGMKRVAKSLLTAYRNGDDESAREDMSLSSLYSGLALANGKLGAVHGFAGPLGGMFSAAHGTICACLLPHVIRANVHALKERSPHSAALQQFDEVGRILTGDSMATAGDGVDWINELCTTMKVPSLAELGVGEDDFPLIVEKAQQASSMKGNPIELTAQELVEILKEAF